MLVQYSTAVTQCVWLWQKLSCVSYTGTIQYCSDPVSLAVAILCVLVQYSTAVTQCLWLWLSCVSYTGTINTVLQWPSVSCVSYTGTIRYCSDPVSLAVAVLCVMYWYNTVVLQWPSVSGCGCPVCHILVQCSTAVTQCLWLWQKLSCVSLKRRTYKKMLRKLEHTFWIIWRSWWKSIHVLEMFGNCIILACS